MMLANDQIKELARRLEEEARHRAELQRDANGRSGGRAMGADEREPLWEAAARASNVIAEIAAMNEDEEMQEPDRGRRASYLESELELALDAVKTAKRALKWRSRPTE